MNIRKTTLLFSLSLALFVGGLSFASSQQASAAYNGGRIIDNGIFLNANSMSAAQIQSFLASKGSGLASRSFVLQCYGANSQERQLYTSVGAACDQNMSAANIIYYASRIYGINPQVILATLQKEQSLITTANPTSWQLNQAMGYGCPTTGNCSGNSTFSYQIDSGVWVQRYHYERANGNNNWWSPSTSWVCGTEKNFYKPNLYPGQNVRFYDGNNVLYRTHYIENAATSSFYCYTPHAYNNPQGLYGRAAYGTTGQYYSGSYNFVSAFESWFGSTIGAVDMSCKNSINVAGRPTGGKVVPNQFGASGNSTFTLTLPNNTGTGCIEGHTWGTNQQAWITNVATNHPSVDPADGEVISANQLGDSKSELSFIKYRNTGSGRIEIHIWDNSYQRWVHNIATNHPAIDPADSEVIAGDMNGDGRDEMLLIKYRNTGSGRIEVHTWSPNKQAWISNIASSVVAGDPADARVIAANLYGDSRDELVFVKYRNTGSGRIEVHTWAPGLQNWISNIATNHPVVDSNDIEVIGANVYGGAVDELVLVKYRNSGSGRVEIHTWAPNQQSWLSNIATNYGAL